ncbi:helix-turn-helix transcriptional regulator [Halolamina sp. C58]|uniref:helix-turn-helix transcriptional regulator n=1 Tax=Halolamina sp. C58 TaxID=3421640 RepID=UPI003EBF0516
MGDNNAPHILRTAARRQRAFAEFEEGNATRSDIQDALGVSRSTAFRVVNTFESLGLISRQNGTYELTPFGDVVHSETSRAIGTIRIARSLSPLLDALEETEEPIEIRAFDDATVTELEPGDPYKPMRRFLSLTEETSCIREFTPTTPDPAYQNTLYDRVRDDLWVAVLYPPSVVDQLRQEGDSEFERAREEGEFHVRVSDPPAFRLVVTDERVYVGGYNDDASFLQLVVDTANPDVQEWATRCFESQWKRGTPFDSYVEGLR